MEIAPGSKHQNYFSFPGSKSCPKRKEGLEKNKEQQSRRQGDQEKEKDKEHRNDRTKYQTHEVRNLWYTEPEAKEYVALEEGYIAKIDEEQVQLYWHIVAECNTFRRQTLHAGS